MTDHRPLESKIRTVQIITKSFYQWLKFYQALEFMAVAMILWLLHCEVILCSKVYPDVLYCIGKTYCLGKRRQCNTSAKSEDYPKRINSNITDKVLMSISRECGSKYVELGIGLGLEYKTIMNRLSQHEGKSDHMKAFEVLQEWKGRNFSCEMLAEALEEVGLKEIALKYCYEL